MKQCPAITDTNKQQKTFQTNFKKIYIYIFVVQRIVTSEDRHDRRGTLCSV